MLQFIKAYIKSMRLYYSFVTGIAGWVGVVYYEYIAETYFAQSIQTTAYTIKKIVILILLFLSWGINQIINDYLGLDEDRINAPDRPMVTGELNPKAALAVTGCFLVLSGVITWFYLEPIAVLFLIAGVVLNVLYEYAKGYGILGNIVFGLMISMAALYGCFAPGPVKSHLFLIHGISAFILIFILNAIMTFYTYFKDYNGDKETGKNTIVVVLGLHKSKILALGAAFVPVIVFMMLSVTKALFVEINTAFIILGLLTVFLLIRTGVLYYKNPAGEKTYDSLKVNFQACVCGEAALMALFNPGLAMVLFIISYILVGFLFELHRNRKA